jgi:hypothetical protein
MVNIGLTTFAENPEPTRSDGHAWSASPLYEFFATICGINPSSAGFKTVRIEPKLGNLKHIKASIPHPKGEVKVEFKKNEGATELSYVNISLPEGVKGEFVNAKNKVIEFTNTLILAEKRKIKPLHSK